MAMQQQNSSFAKKYGARASAANEQYKDQPVDLGGAQLPPGIRNGVAKLSRMYTKQQQEEKKKIPKGETYFVAEAICVSPETFGTPAEKTAGLLTRLIIPLCDMPATKWKGAIPFEQNYGEMQSYLRAFGAPPCPETKRSDPNSEKTEAYWFKMMELMLREGAPPIFVSFSTSEFVPTPEPDEKPRPMTIHKWHGKAEANGQLTAPHDPGSGVVDQSEPPVDGPPVRPNVGAAFSDPPTGLVMPSRPSPDGLGEEPEPATTDSNAEQSLEDEVNELVELASVESITEEGADAARQLEEMAQESGWTEEQVHGASDWVEVGKMILSGPQPETVALNSVPLIGSKWKFRKRDKEGKPLQVKGKDVAAMVVEVSSVDRANKTCTLKTADGKDVTPLRGKDPIVVKWEWLEHT